jgi:hypothetical protein
MNIADRVTILVSRYMFLTMPDTMKPSYIISYIQVTCKSNMAANMAADMAPEHNRHIRKNSHNGI